MKKLFFILLTILIHQKYFSQKFPSNVDSLKTEKEVENLINSIIKAHEPIKIKKIADFQEEDGPNNFCKRIADSLEINQSFYTADFDLNGYTDLMAFGDHYDFSIFIVMNYGKNSLKVNRLTRRSFQNCTFPKIKNDSIIQYYYMSEPDLDSDNKQKPKLMKKDLIFKFGDFIEYNENPNSYSIEKIEYQTGSCFGTCPKFYISIDKNRNGLFKAEYYNINDAKSNQEIVGTFKTLITKTNYDEIIHLLNYIDFPKLQDRYSVNWTDDHSSTLKITYNNGKIKEIKDYGLIGTYGLDRVYSLLFDLRFNQDWKK
ncbi:Uncharacterised protein [Chryseobacterium nakagawai]|uniref:DUF6438 domain-containing protein n=1 Tax=Chryseobacterium nakagawai TaxID=1241982 RepID=A0AAD0YQG4_CHRNA|nr:DUF6438 domain-containing protein [Chryseobacterium nakagawai]AZA93179.1 hypothetical protein EG343_22515 [Chryseobacterium nakagawai]VEH19831.1 Uncharacterised protein [Chryseobacterium nakagawai]